MSKKIELNEQDLLTMELEETFKVFSVINSLYPEQTNQTMKQVEKGYYLNIPIWDLISDDWTDKGKAGKVLLRRKAYLKRHILEEREKRNKEMKKTIIELNEEEDILKRKGE